MVIRVCKILRGTSYLKNRHRWFSRSVTHDVEGKSAEWSEGYEAGRVEEEVTSLWDSYPVHPVFGANVSHTSPPSTKFSMILPPPNITGTLHLGHALTTTIQDVIAKRRRILGDDVMWVPGVDHAGIATQAVVERVLGACGHDVSTMPSEQLLSHIHQWKTDNMATILSQLRQLAPSLHWDRLFFTLDPRQSGAVKEAFSRLFKEGLIYRADRLINWSVKLGTAVSDMEVEQRRVPGPTYLELPSTSKPVLFGRMTDIAFSVQGSTQEVVVSTCRVETMAGGDMAVAVHPEDARYTSFHGATLIHPLTSRTLPLILDPAVDPKLGTGAVKVSPGHDQVDFEMASRHGLDVISVIDESGHLNSEAGEYEGVERFEAREMILERLTREGHVRGFRDHPTSVPLCSRTGDVIELLSKPQWFLKCGEMGRRAAEAVEKGDLLIIPQQHQTNWFLYLQNLRDWCISRQVVWGHRLPLLTDGKDTFILENTVSPQDASNLHPVQDVLDTWFSSGLLPFSVFESSEDRNRYFPLDLMVTGHDILFFWVARMVMLSLHLTNHLPFKKVLLHSVICDPQGRKMSKSVGNVIDPQHVIQGITKQGMLKDVEERAHSGVLKAEEAKRSSDNIEHMFPKGIPSCGTDALRMTLLSHKIKSHYIDFDIEGCYLNKLFLNKLWQACRFTVHWSCINLSSMTIDKAPQPTSELDVWLLSKLFSTVHTVDKASDEFDFHIAVNSIKEFVHNVFCDVYLEGVKKELKGKYKEGETARKEKCYILLYTLVTVIKVLAPIAPYVTELLYHRLQPHSNLSVHSSHTSSPHPNTIVFSKDVNKVNADMALCLTVVKEIRRMKLTLNDAKSKQFKVGVSEDMGLSKDLMEVLQVLSGSCVHLVYPDHKDTWTLFSTLNQHLSLYHVTSSHQKINAEATSGSNEAKCKKLQSELEKMLKMRSHENYKIKVPESVQKAQYNKILKLQTEIQQMKHGR